MSVVINFDANSSRVVDAVQAVQGKMEELNATSLKWTQAMGVDAILNNLSRVVSVLGEVGRKVGSLMSAAAEKENVATQLGVMFGAAAEGNVLADALERMATNGVVGMQELQGAAGALIGTSNDANEITHWVGVFADISAGSKISATRLAKEELEARRKQARAPPAPWSRCRINGNLPFSPCSNDKARQAFRQALFCTFLIALRFFSLFRPQRYCQRKKAVSR